MWCVKCDPKMTSGHSCTDVATGMVEAQGSKGLLAKAQERWLMGKSPWKYNPWGQAPTKTHPGKGLAKLSPSGSVILGWNRHWGHYLGMPRKWPSTMGGKSSWGHSRSSWDLSDLTWQGRGPEMSKTVKARPWGQCHRGERTKVRGQRPVGTTGGPTHHSITALPTTEPPLHPATVCLHMHEVR